MLNNPLEEAFAQKWHETGNKSKAYRYIYPEKTKRWKDETVHNKAYAMSKKGEVKARFDELQKETAVTHGITIETLLNELEEARTCALTAETPQSSAAVTATMGKARLTGLDKPIEQSANAAVPINVTIGVKDCSNE